MSLVGLCGNERKCHICGRVFCITPEWVYRKGQGDGVKLFCSWHCLRKYEARKVDRGSREEQIRKLYAQGLDVRQISDRMSLDSRSVSYWVNKIEKEQEHDKVLSEKADQEIGGRTDECKTESEAGK